MINQNNNMKSSTVEGPLFRYHFVYEERIGGEYDVIVTQVWPRIGSRKEFILEAELIDALIEANRERVDPPPSVAEIHNNRGFPTNSVSAGEHPSLNPWKFHEDGMLLNFYREGYSIEEMVEFIGRSADAVIKRLRILGLLDSDNITAMRAEVCGAVSLKEGAKPDY